MNKLKNLILYKNTVAFLLVVFVYDVLSITLFNKITFVSLDFQIYFFMLMNAVFSHTAVWIYQTEKRFVDAFLFNRSKEDIEDF